MNAKDADLRSRNCDQRDRQQRQEEAALENIRCGRGRVFEVCFAVGNVGDGEESGLRRDSAHGVTDGEFREASPSGDGRSRDAREGGGRPEKESASDGFAETGCVREAIGLRGELPARDGDDRGGQSEKNDVEGE